MGKSLVKAFLFLLLASNSFALTDGAKKLIQYETQSNAVSQRDSRPIQMPHFEIPLDMVELDFADRFPQALREHFIFQKDGKKYVRWVLNPEDTKWFEEVQQHFQNKGLKLEKKYYFTGYQTASRSYIVEDPGKKIQFSIKSSTNKTGGWWADKKQPVGEAIDSRLNADFLHDIQARLPFKNIIVMDEPAIFKLPGIDQAVVLRDLVDLNTKADRIYVPGFSVLHDETGRMIAAKNGSNDPYEFWTEHYIKATGRALGELAARTGMQFDSPHSQNFLVELDANLKPTGRIVIRDLADLYIDKTIMKELHPQQEKYFKEFSQRGNILGSIAAGFGPLHGNEAPSWVRDSGYSAWKNVFFKEFESTFEKITSLKPSQFKSSEGHINGKYFGNTYSVAKNEGTEGFWKNMSIYKNPAGVMLCSQTFK
ncbi:MAG: hypothetical protein JSU04_16000 [Bdellovibrionales bacterium]|nr:hypothetical protein [Bdellovibrionales bacterium]